MRKVIFLQVVTSMEMLPQEGEIFLDLEFRKQRIIEAISKRSEQS
jgi:hypothetical protein